ncbi:L-lactate dehydrogenase [Dactylonectria macrodidyma]|uniref:Oxidase FUB9 n=1 Tax=Dactylonectria macrodidyma TaxID=307937 RepID=A0A9P9JHI6_9HYPO|nr:L-lactate dehydrogenase [Dactylonectria macrodidyma]
MAADSSTPKATKEDLKCLSIAELEVLARSRMDQQTRDYYNEGSDSGITLQENSSAYNKYRIRPRALRDVSNIDTSVDIFGFKNKAPFGVAPAAMQKLAHPDGELATARACRERGIIMGLSSFSTTSLEDVRKASGEIPNVFQLYLFEDRARSKELIQRVKDAGYKAVVLTVDTPVLGRRNLEIRNQFQLPSYLKAANFVDEPGFEGTTQSRPPVTFHTHGPNPTLCWEDTITWLKKEAGPMQVWVKGILTAEDALLAVNHGVDGIIVSNHGGRQLDGAMATLDALPEIVAAVKNRVPIHIDGGIRHGLDLFKALALGADFCWIGRPVLWGLAYKGQEGVELCLKLLTEQLHRCMALAGVTRVEDIGPEYLCKMDRDGFVSRL